MAFSSHDIYQSNVADLKKSKNFRALELGIFPSLQQGYVQIGTQDFLNLASNDYLGLTLDPAIAQAGIDACKFYGNGSGSARLVSGQFDFYAGVEEKLARFKGKKSAIIGASGYQVGSSVLAALVNPDLFDAEPLVLFDKYNHASLYAGMAMAGVKPIRYRHHDLKHLEQLLQQHADGKRPVFIVTESLFSMDGDLLDIELFLEISKKYKAFTLVDDAHAVGVYGFEGRGLCYDYPDIDVVLGTFSKAFGCFGGYVACSSLIADFLRNKAGGVVYSTSLPPFVWGMIDKAMDVIIGSHETRIYLHNLAEYTHELFQKSGFNGLKSTSQIIPIVFGNNDKTLKAQDLLRENGFFIKAIRTPTVPAGTARLRLSLTPFIHPEKIQEMCDILKKHF